MVIKEATVLHRQQDGDQRLRHLVDGQRLTIFMQPCLDRADFERLQPHTGDVTAIFLPQLGDAPAGKAQPQPAGRLVTLGEAKTAVPKGHLTGFAVGLSGFLQPGNETVTQRRQFGRQPLLAEQLSFTQQQRPRMDPRRWLVAVLLEIVDDLCIQIDAEGRQQGRQRHQTLDQARPQLHRPSECSQGPAEAAGIKSPVLDDIRAEIWLKLWGNLTFNPISALAHATLAGICRYPLTRELAADMMREAQAVAAKLGIGFRVTLERRIAGAEKVGEHKTSMLQDVEAGRAPEIDALVGSVAELGRLTGTPTPHIDTVYALVKLLAQTIAAGPSQLRVQPLRATA